MEGGKEERRGRESKGVRRESKGVKRESKGVRRESKGVKRESKGVRRESKGVRRGGRARGLIEFLYSLDLINNRKERNYRQLSERNIFTLLG